MRPDQVLLLDDGSAVAVGNSSCGKTSLPAPPPGRKYTAAAAGLLHTVLLLDDGSAVAVRTRSAPFSNQNAFVFRSL